MNFAEMNAAMQDAKSVLQMADHYADSLAHMLNGRLRNVRSVTALRRLKRQLRDFDMTTGTWK